MVLQNRRQWKIYYSFVWVALKAAIVDFDVNNKSQLQWSLSVQE